MIYNLENLPVDVDELRKSDIDWKVITHNFDFDVVAMVIGLWKKYGDKRAVAMMMLRQMNVENLRGISVQDIQPVEDLLYGYKYEEGSKEFQLLTSRAHEEMDLLRREKLGIIDRLIKENYDLQQQVSKLNEQLKKESALVEARTKEVDKWQALYEEERKIAETTIQEVAFNGQTGKPCFTSRQMGIFLHAVSSFTEDTSPGKTTLGNVVEKISGYSATTIQQNMKGSYRSADIEVVASALEEKLPKLAEKVRKM
ncbi:MAG: hypothetical protein J5905_03205 [Prevotella sp.]|nr:hypothetical protein [Prevotella sp.]